MTIQKIIPFYESILKGSKPDKKLAFGMIRPG